MAHSEINGISVTVVSPVARTIPYFLTTMVKKDEAEISREIFSIEWPCLLSFARSVTRPNDSLKLKPMALARKEQKEEKAMFFNFIRRDAA